MSNKLTNNKFKQLMNAGAESRRMDVSNLNQKASVFHDKRTKRQRTRAAQNKKAIDESMEE